MTTVLDVLCEEMTPGANLDSAVQWPQPSCYPGTCIRLTTEIQTWFFNNGHKWNFLWLSGPTGVGKSAVAQTVAKYALEHDILGAIYFFSRPNQQNKYIEVFITLAYQLAIHFPGYQTLMGAKLVAEPDLLMKTPCIQLRKLIVEPLLLLSHEQKCVIILDGLDECDDEDNQLEIVKLINDLVCSNIPLPIIWMICSWPESHLKWIFTRSDYAIQCWQEFLPIDSEESRSDTDVFICGQFKVIHKRYGECVDEGTDSSWPPEASIQQIVQKMSGLFVLADTFLRYIEDPVTRNPDQHLGKVLALLEYSHVTGSRNPMHDLDLFYSRILSSIPDDHWPITCQILIASTIHFLETEQMAVQPLCNFLGIARAKFYAAMSHLHSVVHVPEPPDAADTPLHFFHATFLDYLTDPTHAGHFFIGWLVTNNRVTVASAGLWDLVLSGLQCLGSAIGLCLVWEHQKEIQDNEEVCRSLKAALSWPSDNAHANWAHAMAAVHVFRFYFSQVLSLLLVHSELDDNLLDVLCHFDFNILSLTAGQDIPISPPGHFNKLVIFILSS
ncbi:hypothetical protein P691DRAFT_686786 [Macrolepiota fuliginosa MF-IS2]|uniref:Nephrocystin 3-like N-terminal domain-containing protein n=1 Tax=Macrolepiota fuliginosa MF-IS2 TaxID=1400762 RepID=A0A9P6BUU1_9AGAR|nr:hypothetical protein P691DRAFT_686786 [Macrolepiota fuliginosa MF-IS2]